MSSSLALWLLVAVTLYLLRSGWRFRRGADRRLLWVYRSPTLPRVFRNFLLVEPLAMLVLAPSFAAAALFLDAPIDFVVRPAVRGLGLIGAGCFMLAIAAISVFLFRPPAWLRPQWLSDDDRKAGYEPPPPRALDWIYLFGIGVPAGTIGLIAIGAGIRTITTGG